MLLPCVELKNNDGLLLINNKLCPIFQENDTGPTPDFEYREVFIKEHELSKWKRALEKIIKTPLHMKPMAFYDSLTETNKPLYVIRVPKETEFSGYLIGDTIHYHIV